MRTFFFLVFVLGMIVGGVYLGLNRSSMKPYEIPFLTKDYLTLQPTSSENNNVVTSDSGWDNILIGRWNFHHVIREKNNIQKFNGEVNYRADSTFTRYVTIYSFNEKISKDQPQLVAGGSLHGEWIAKPEKNIWTEVIQECNLKISSSMLNKRITPCDTFFDEEERYGQISSEYSKVTIKEFSKSKIVIVHKDFSSGYEDRYEFRKQY